MNKIFFKKINQVLIILALLLNCQFLLADDQVEIAAEGSVGTITEEVAEPVANEVEPPAVVAPIETTIEEVIEAQILPALMDTEEVKRALESEGGGDLEIEFHIGAPAEEVEIQNDTPVTTIESSTEPVEEPKKAVSFSEWQHQKRRTTVGFGIPIGLTGIGLELHLTPKILIGTPITFSIRGTTTGFTYTVGAQIQVNILGTFGIKTPIDITGHVGLSRTAPTGLLINDLSEDDLTVFDDLMVNPNFVSWNLNYGLGLEYKGIMGNGIYLKIGLTDMLNTHQVVEGSQVIELHSLRLPTAEIGFRFSFGGRKHKKARREERKAKRRSRK
ncbi:MAG: hypothetical protein HOE90_13280 [Bacteriovoracaceae bacterium]|nr:hypothetical protein [Bacteriovoracaceae bacterium]